MKKFMVKFMAAVFAMAVLTGCGNAANGTADAGKEAGVEETPSAAVQDKAEESSGAVEEAPEAAEGTAQESGQSPAIETETDGTVADRENTMIGMLASTSGIMDESFNQSAWEGLQWLSGDSGVQVDYVEGNTDDEMKMALESLINEGCTICWGVGYTTAPSVIEAAKENPDVRFVIVDYVDENMPDNVTCVKFRAQEPSFLVGYVAGMTTESDSVGFVGGMEIDVIKEFMYGYKAGVATAAKERGKDIEVKTCFADGFFEPEQGKELAKGLYDDGCDIVYHAAGKTGSGVIEAAKERGKYVIGVDKDQSFMAPENVLTSALKLVNIAVKEVSEDIMAGNLEGINIVNMGLSEEAVGISENHSLYDQKVYDKVKEFEYQILSGELDPPANEEEYNAFVK